MESKNAKSVSRSFQINPDQQRLTALLTEPDTVANRCSPLLAPVCLLRFNRFQKPQSPSIDNFTRLLSEIRHHGLAQVPVKLHSY